MCEPCRRKQNREYYFSIGICPRCRKEKLYNGERKCLECKAKEAELAIRRYHANAEKIQARDSERKKRRYTSRKEAGICVKCGRRNTSENHAYCRFCRVTRRNKERLVISRSERVAYGLCYFCGEPLDRDGRSCTKCAERCTKTLERNRPKRNEAWAKDNDLIFKGV